MNLKTLIEQSEWADVWPVLVMLYPDQIDFNEYEQVFTYLERADPLPSQFVIVIEQKKDFWEEWHSDVNGRYHNETEADYCLAFSPWAEWLGMPISDQTLMIYPTLEIVAHCLWEMTVYGFTESDIQSALKEVTDVIEEYKPTGNEPQE